MAKRALVALGLLAITAACGGDDDEPPCAAVGTGARGYDALSYRLTARFDWDTQTLTAREEITVACRAQAQLTFDAEVEVATVTIAGQPAPFSVDAAAHTLTVDTGGTSGPVTLELAYTAPVSDALRVGGPRDDDPVPSRIAFTDSEPDRGRRWLIAKHDPADRATFAVELTMPAEHDAIANGERTVDRAAGAERVVGYALDQPIPTYLMAFATGPLERVERTTGRVPLAVWYRRGLPVDGEAHLDLLEELMTTFEVRLGPYPWSRYAVVLLPQFGGGMENATITFNNETSGLGALGVNLNAHELAHQWFGDWVTMHTYDDVWVKEGMATMLAAEAEVARRDRAEVGRWFGSDFAFNVDDAVVDTNLTGLAKYTSGPYQRSAWVMTQLRRRIGDDAFWAGARKLLADRALGTATGAQFLASFTPALDDTTMAQALASLPVHGAPSIAVAVSAGAGGTTLGFTLDDPDRLLLAPIEVGAVDATGAAAPLAALPTTVVVPDGGYLALDPDGVHPYWPYVFGPWATYFDQVEPRLAPRTEAALAAFASRAPAQQERGLYAGLPIATRDSFADLYPSLDSTEAQATAAVAACRALPTLGEPEASGLGAALGPGAADAGDHPLPVELLGLSAGGGRAGARRRARGAGDHGERDQRRPPRLPAQLRLRRGADPGALRRARDHRAQPAPARARAQPTDRPHRRAVQRDRRRRAPSLATVLPRSLRRDHQRRAPDRGVARVGAPGRRRRGAAGGAAAHSGAAGRRDPAHDRVRGPRPNRRRGLGRVRRRARAVVGVPGRRPDGAR
jgi:aminopeptidase N